MGGEASIIVGRRSLASYAFEPLRQMREAMSTGRPRGERLNVAPRHAGYTNPRSHARRFRAPRSADAGVPRARAAGGAHRLAGADPGRVGDRQDDDGAGDPQLVQRAPAGRSSRSTPRRSATRCSTASCSATSAARSPARRTASRASSSWPIGGTLFLDEIADLSPQGQSKILRAIEYGEFERLGSETLRAGRRAGPVGHALPGGGADQGRRFREDLFYRINGVTVMRAAAARPRPRPAGAARQRDRARQPDQGKSIVGLSRTAADRLFTYHWPGNLRELSKVVQAAVALTTGSVIPEEVLLFQNDSSCARCPLFFGQNGRPGRPTSLLSQGGHSRPRPLRHAAGTG